MSRSYKKNPQGHRHLSEKADKKISSRKVRRINNDILSSDEDAVFKTKKEVYDINWIGQKESCGSYQSVYDTYTFVKKSIEKAKHEVTNDVWYREYRSIKYSSIDDMFDNWSDYKKSAVWKKPKQKSWAYIKHHMFYSLNDPLLKILGIHNPQDLWNISDKNIMKATNLLHKYWYLSK